ncbi:hypothetical protein [Paenibacillus sp. 32352]|uniref:hypothetical protein n=1 Tax=Paenibacillus sp. 32352 TaxID=1969111 RepID=UPI0009ACE638|nr:hypothetical protein [Paenibacillus sp. 32352]
MLGLNAEEMMKTFASGGPQAKEAFGKILQMIAAVEDPVDKNTIGVALMGTQFEDLEATVVEAMGVAQNQFDMTKDTMSEINNIKFENAGQALAMIGRQIETGVIQPIGNLLLPLLSSLSVAIGFVIDHFDIFGPALAAFGIIIAVAVAPALLGMAAAGWAAIAPWLPFIGIAVAVGAAVAGLVYAWKNNMFGLQDWTNQALEKAKAIFDSLLIKVNTVFSGIKSYIDSIMPYIQQIFETVMPIIKTIFLTHLTIMGEVTNLVFNTAWDIISWAFNNIWNLVSIVWTAISGIFKAFLQFITGDFSGAFSTLQETIGKVFEGIKTYFVEFVGGAIDIGKNFVQGLIQGVLNSAGAVWDAVTSIGKGMKDSITSFLDIHSPSRVMMEVGYFTGEGLAQGIASTEQQVNNASLGLAEEIVSPYDQQAASAPTPASAPAAASYAAGGSNQSFHFVIEVKGDTPVSQQSAVEIKNELAPAIQEIFESTGRRLSLAGGAG